MAPRPNEDPANWKATGGARPDLTWDKFILVCEVLAETGSKYKACEALSFNYSTIQNAIKEAADRGDDEWQELWDGSYDQFRDRLEQAAITRHVDGVTSKRFDKDGNLISEEQVFSDRMGELLLKGHFPERYRDKIFVSGSVGLEPVDAFANLTAKAKRAIRAIIMADLEEQRQLEVAASAADVIEGSVTQALADMSSQADEDDA